jgi:hypothetical protein
MERSKLLDNRTVSDQDRLKVMKADSLFNKAGTSHPLEEDRNMFKIGYPCKQGDQSKIVGINGPVEKGETNESV